MKNNKGQSNAMMATFITLLVVAVVGIPVMLSTVDDVVSDVVDTNTATDENVSIVNDTTITLANADGNDIVVDSETAENKTGTTYTKDENYTIDYDAGTITWINVDNAADGNTGNVTYDYRDEQYVSNESTRNLLDIIPILVALLVLLAVITIGIMKFV